MNFLQKALLTVTAALVLSVPALGTARGDNAASSGTPAETAREAPEPRPGDAEAVLSPGGGGVNEAGGRIGPEDEPAETPGPEVSEKELPAEKKVYEKEELTKAPDEESIEVTEGDLSTEKTPGLEKSVGNVGRQEPERPSGIESAPDTKPEDEGRDTAHVVPYIEPLFVKAMTEISTGHNDYNPVWSPSGRMLAFERNIGGKREIHIVRQDGTLVTKVYYKLSESEEELDFFLPGISEEVSYNSSIVWARSEDRFVFMSNAATGNYDVYVRELESETAVRLTEHAGKDGQADWSPTTNLLVFVSGRSGKAELYLMDLVTMETARLTNGKKAYLYPQWSPDGSKVAMIYGSNENHDIQVIADISKPEKSTKSLTTWEHDDLRPTWSPDGKKIAFYTNYNPDGDPKLWSIAVVGADATGPTEGEGLAARVVTTNVVPDVERGPAWLPDSKRIAYVKNDEKQFNPIYIVNVDDKSEVYLNTGTKMNHDISCSVDGIIAFRAQVEQWDHIYVARPKDTGLKAWRAKRR